MINKELDIFIEKYLSGELSREEITHFEQLLEKDPEFKQALAEQKLIKEASIEHGLQDIKEKLQQIHQKHQNKKSSRLLKKIIAVSLIAGLAIGSYIIFNSPQKNKENTFIYKQTQPDTLINQNNHTGKEEPNKTKNNSEPQIQDEDINKTQKNDPVKNELDSPKPKQRNKERLPVQLNTKDQKQIKEFNSSLNTKDLALKLTNPCNKAFNIELITSPSCYENANGKIILVNKNETEVPYKIFRQEKKFILDDSLIYNNLNHGTYHFKIESINKCDTTIIVHVNGKDCRPSLKFAPAYGETIDIPLKNGANGIIVIKSKGGEIMVQESVNNAPFFTWDGRASSGGYVPMGVYLYTISYADGSKENGFITVLR